MIKHHEFWHPRFFEIPYYFYLIFQCLINRVSFKSLAKANYALDHGEIGLGSKYESQLAFDQSYFLPTILILDSLTPLEKEQEINCFVERHAYPVILKSDVGCVGKGICKISNDNELKQKLPLLLGDYILQKFTPYQQEYGVFFIRQQGQAKISGMNKKHFPSVTGNGEDNILSLATQHQRYTHHWHSFLQSIDTKRIPLKGEEVRLSFIGSHTLGCKFTDDTHRVSPELEGAIFDFFESQQGFNFGRFDVKAESEEALLAGQFVVIEVNGIASLPTNMFDPALSLREAYRIFLYHGKLLVKIAKEHQNKEMNLLPYRKIIEKVKANQSLLNKVHDLLKSSKQ
ncbi:MAG: hypothetical protein ACJAUP_000173 [Cellvibrionaceae bacterium]|jgi:hypothetical protein